MIDFEKELNAEQLAVVQNGDGPCLVLAGAGSGKTRTITYRVAYLLEKGISPENILLVTFTNKAAKEMMDRVQLITKSEKRLPWSGTFHHIGFRILKKYAPLLGYKNNFSILDSEDSNDLLKLCMKQEGIDRKERRFPSPGVLHGLLSYSRNAEKSLEEVLDEKHPQWLSIADVIGRIADDYAKRKREANAMDFDDLLVNTHLLLAKSDAVRKKYSEQFQYVLVDEYQDTNKVQASIIKLLASYHRNVLVVGDDAQSIYSFRAADIENILSFSARGGENGYPDAKIFYLTTNYRSTPDILSVANNIISNNREQYQKELKSIREKCVKPKVKPFADASEEGEFIAQEILTLRDEGVPLSDMAVLFRAAFHSQALELELTKRDIPYDYRGGIRFFERAHIKDVLAYLRIVHNIEDIVAWSRVLNMQVGIGPAAAQSIFEMIKKSNYNKNVLPLPVQTGVVGGGEEGVSHGPMPSIELPARAQVGWNDFLQIWQAMAVHTELRPADLITAVIHSKYAEYLENEYPDYRERLQDLEQLATFAERQKDLNQFLADASLQESYTSRQARRTDTDDEDRLVLSTIHQAKGLEWEAVFILHLSAGQFPNDRALREAKGIEEERRLFYVAVTRAKKHLYLTYPLVGSFNSTLSGPSMFIDEIDRDLVDAETLMGSSVFSDSGFSDGEVQYVPIDEPFPNKQRPVSFLKSIDEL